MTSTVSRRIDLGIRLVVLTAALVIPIVFFLKAYEAFQMPKSVVLCVTGTIALVLMIARGGPIRSRTLFAAALFLAGTIPSMLNTPLLAASLERFWELASFAVLLVAAESTGIPVIKLLAVVLAAHFLVTVYGAIQYLDLDWINWTSFGERRVYSTSGNPDFLAAQTSFLLPVIVCLYAAIRGGVARPLLVICFLFSLPSLFYTQARGAFLGFTASLASLGWLAHRYVYRLTPRQLLKWSVSSLGAFLVILLLLPTGRVFIERFGELAHPTTCASVQIRLFYWYSSWLMGIESHTVGSGIGAFHLSGARTQGEMQQIWNRRWPNAANWVSPHLELYAHNDYAHLFAEIGPVGLGLFLWIMVCLLAGARAGLAGLAPARTRDRWMLIGLLAGAVSFYVNCMTNFPLKVVSNAHTFFSCMALGLLSCGPFAVRGFPLRRNTAVTVLTALAGLYLSGRACTMLAASVYLKTGHQFLLYSNEYSAKGDARTAASLADLSFKRFDSSERLRPFHTDAILVFYYRGKARQNRGEIDAAIADFTRSIDTFRHFPEGFQARGTARLARYMQMAEKRPGDSAKAAMELAAASADLEYSYFLNPKDPSTCFYLGAVRRLQGRPADAIPFMRDAIRYSLDRIPDANYGLALSYLETGRTAEGREVLESLLTRAPGQTPAAGLLARLKAGKLPRTAAFRSR